MKLKLVILALSPMLAAQLCFAQATSSGDDAKPATSNVPGQKYPQIHSDLRVDFRLKAPDAQKVKLHLDKDYDLQRGSDGTWNVTTTPQVPGFHYYWFIVDGVNVSDPASETFFGVSRQYSGIEIPSAGEDFYEAKNVPHGEIREHLYFPRSPARGGASLFIRRRIMTRARRAIRCCICSTAAAKTSAAGPYRAA